MTDTARIGISDRRTCRPDSRRHRAMRRARLPVLDRRFLLGLVIVLGILQVSFEARAQSPELSMREFASGQIKKGVRSIGFGGDGATWGNYGLVYRDAATALADVGVTDYTNGNLFTFTAVGATTPPIWRGLVIYLIALSQHAEDRASIAVVSRPRTGTESCRRQRRRPGRLQQDRCAAGARILGGGLAVL